MAQMLETAKQEEYEPHTAPLLDSKKEPEYTEHHAPLLEPAPTDSEKLAELAVFFEQHPELRIPETPKSPTQLPGFLKNIDSLLRNEYIKTMAITSPELVESLLDEYVGKYKPILLTHLKLSHREIYNALQQGKFEAGDENTDEIDEYAENGKNGVYAKFDTPEMSEEMWTKVIEDMVRMDDEGKTPGKIRDFIFDDYGVELSHQQVSRYIERYRTSKKAEEAELAEERAEEARLEEITRKARENAQQKVLSLADEHKKLLAEKYELEKKLAIKEALERASENSNKSQVERTPEVHRGVVRRIFRWFW